MAEAVLTINAGSSSLKYALFSGTPSAGELRQLGSGSLALEPPGERSSSADDSVEHILEWAQDMLGKIPLTRIGHRVVHGGDEFTGPVEIGGSVLERLEAHSPLAPLHQPACLEPIRAIQRVRPQVRQFASFDTAFHRTIAPPAGRYALPRSFETRGIRRYGFHGLSYQSIADQLRGEGAERTGEGQSRVIVAHLGSGASLCAMFGLRSADTTMGFSVLDGLVMGTRPGTIDPGILLHLLVHGGMSAAELEKLLYRESGLLGVSGISADVSVLLASGAPEAAEALDLFAFQAAKQIAAMATTLEGVDRIVFTGGIGENSPQIRQMIVRRIGWMGAEIDETANASAASLISSSDSSIKIERRTSGEDRVIASQALACEE